MCRMLGYVTKVATTIPELLGESFNSFERLSTAEHGDGWGVGWLADGSVKIEKAPTAALSDPKYRDVLTAARSNAAILHYRWATMNLGVTLENSHPFSISGTAFCHNGSISSIDVLRSYVDPKYLKMLHGTTDSEAFFGAVYSAGFGENPLGAISSTVRKIVESCEYSSLNAMILTPKSLYVVSAHENDKAPKQLPKDYYTIRYQPGDEGIVVASSGWNQEGWLELPNYSIFELATDGTSTLIHDLYDL